MSAAVNARTAPIFSDFMRRSLRAAGTSPRRANVCTVWRESVVSAAADAGELVRTEVDRRERAWVRDAQRGSAPALEQLFRSHWPRAYRAALLVVGDAAAAEDIAQESFLAAVRALDRFDRRRPFGPWLHRIVVNRAIDWARARALRPEAEAVDTPALERPERDDELLRELGRLSPEHRAVIVLRYLLEYTPGEIAELFSLPAPGRLLVSGSGGTWIVNRDGSRRRLGSYRDAAWSPHGLFVAATRPNELLALDTKGNVRWTLPRRSPRFPAWTGTRADTRIAYLAGGKLHVVAGDGTGDHAIGPAAAVPPVWLPGRVVVYSNGRR